MSEIDDIIRHTIETVQYALREGFKQGWDSAARHRGENPTYYTVQEARERDQRATEYADSFNQGLSEKLSDIADDIETEKDNPDDVMDHVTRLRGIAEDPRRGQVWNEGDKVRHQNGQPVGEVITTHHTGLIEVRWESGITEWCQPEELTPA